MINAHGTATLVGSANGTSSWATVHAFDNSVGNTYWRNASQSYTAYTATVSSPLAYRYYRLVTQRNPSAEFDFAIHSLILTGY